MISFWQSVYSDATVWMEGVVRSESHQGENRMPFTALSANTVFFFFKNLTSFQELPLQLHNRNKPVMINVTLISPCAGSCHVDIVCGRWWIRTTSASVPGCKEFPAQLHNVCSYFHEVFQLPIPSTTWWVAVVEPLYCVIPDIMYGRL